MDVSAKRIRFLTALAFVATLGMWANFAYYSFFADTQHWKFPDNTFLCLQISRFSDFYDMVLVDRGLDPYNIGHLPLPHAAGSGYPPLAHLLFHLCSQLGPDFNGIGTDGSRKALDPAFWLFFGIPFFTFPIIALAWIKPKQPWLAALLVMLAFNFSYPMLFEIDRGNLEIQVFLMVTTFAWLVNSTQRKLRVLALLCIGVASALKVYPLIFLLIYAVQGRWRSAFSAVAICGLLTVLSYGCLDGGIWANLRENYRLLGTIQSKLTVNVMWATWYSSSLFSLLYLTLRVLFDSDSASRWLQFHFSLISGVFLLTSCSMLYARRLSFGRLFMAVCCLAILATAESPDYKLLLLFPATIALIVEDQGTRVFNLLFVAAVGLLLVPKNWVMIQDRVSIGSIINPALVLVLLVLMLLARQRPTPENTLDIGMPN
jgi:hypothetical protein